MKIYVGMFSVIHCNILGCWPAVTSGMGANIVFSVLKEQKAASFYLDFSHLPFHLFQSFIELLFMLFLLLCFLVLSKVAGV